MIVSSALLKDLQKRVTLLEEDLRRRCDADPQVNAPLQIQYEAARESQRTAETFNAWRDEQITQIAVAWVLACVFVRFLEDNQLLDTPFLAGPDAARMNRARDEQELFFKQHPTASERDYLLNVFGAVGQLPGMREFFDRRHNPLWLAGPTGDALAGLLDFWRKTNPDTGRLVHDFSDPAFGGNVEPLNRSNVKPLMHAAAAATTLQRFNASTSYDPTRFLGDLYQDLSEFARKHYALLQTPEFVEQFILDRTLTPAIDTFGYRVVRMLDLTCGSGHFLLGGFDRLFKLWQEHEPGDNPRVLAQRALDQVCGVDLNPNVVAIARFRLLLAALRACLPAPDAPPLKLKDAPDFKIHLAVGDSLLHGARFHPTEEREAVQQTFGGDELFRDELQHFYDTEDRDALHQILGRQYHVVVGNPPYIAVKDKALNQLYRDRFDSCHRKYSLAAPFMERFFDFAIRGEPAMKWNPLASQPGNTAEIRNQKSEIRNPGFVGMITANSFMKREFGSKLIEECIPRWDLTHVIDTAGAYIPGHGTPTVILFGKHQSPVAATIRAVMGIKGEPSTPEDPARGLVWIAILRQVEQPGSESDYVSVADSPRESFHKHPWSIGGGGAAELKEQLDEAAETTLDDVIELIGVFGMTNVDDIFFAPPDALARMRVEPELLKKLVTGDDIRDWCILPGATAVFPYDQERLLPLGRFVSAQHWLWNAKTVMGNRATFSKLTYFAEGRPWWEWHQVGMERLRTPFTITFGFVATHNHFALDQGGAVFNRHAPIIKLPADATEADHWALVGVLNSSLACFWMKQILHNKGSTVDQRGARQRTAPFEDFFEFDGSKLKKFPIPAEKPLSVARELDRLAQELKAHAPNGVIYDLGFRNSDLGERPAVSSSENHKSEILNLKSLLSHTHTQWTDLLQRMIALQEELDWECYRIYGLLPDSSLSFPRCASAALRLGVEPGASEITQRCEDAKPQGTVRESQPSPQSESPIAPASLSPLCASAPLRLGVESETPELTQRREDAKTQGSGQTDLPSLKLGERAFEIVLARKLARGEAQTAWFERHGSTPITELPAHWPAAYRALVERRIALIERDRNIALIEQPEYKRRWNTEPWDEQQERALRQWLLNRLEGYFFEGERMLLPRPATQERGEGRGEGAFGPSEERPTSPQPSPPLRGGGGDDLNALRASWRGGQQPALVSTNQLADVVQADATFLKVAEVYVGTAGFSVPKLVRELVEAESVPFLPFQRYKESGLRKRQDWERTWELQRAEDDEVTRRQGDKVNSDSVTPSPDHPVTLSPAHPVTPSSSIPVPPKYASADFKSSTFWRLRGKLDVPKERWVSYPGAEREGDPSPVIAWAGWNHLQQAQAVAEYYITAKDTWGWSPERLQLLLAGLADLLPWLKQWHNELNPEYGMGLGDYFAGFLDEEARKQGATLEALTKQRLGLQPEK